MALCSSGERMPIFFSIVAWAIEPRMSWRHSRQSNEMDSVNRTTSASGPPANRLLRETGALFFMRLTALESATVAPESHAGKAWPTGPEQRVLRGIRREKCGWPALYAAYNRAVLNRPGRLPPARLQSTNQQHAIISLPQKADCAVGFRGGRAVGDHIAVQISPLVRFQIV